MVPSAGHRVPIPRHSFRVTQGVSSQGAASLLLGTGSLSRIQGPYPRAQLSLCRAQGSPSRCAVSLVLGKGPFPGNRVPSPEHRSPPPSTSLPSQGAVSSLMGTGPLPGVQGPLGGHNLLSERRTVGSPRRSASHADEPSWAQPPPAAQRIQEDRGPPSARRPGCASDPAARRGPEPGSIGSGVGGQVRGRRRCAASATCPALT